MRKILAVTLIIAALVFAGTALAASKHGFRNPRTPRLAARMIDTIPNVDRARCHWKVWMHTIGCIALGAGRTAQFYIWSGGRSTVFFDVCVGGTCSKALRAGRPFGRPY